MRVQSLDAAARVQVALGCACGTRVSGDSSSPGRSLATAVLGAAQALLGDADRDAREPRPHLGLAAEARKRADCRDERALQQVLDLERGPTMRASKRSRYGAWVVNTVSSARRSPRRHASIRSSGSPGAGLCTDVDELAHSIEIVRARVSG